MVPFSQLKPTKPATMPLVLAIADVNKDGRPDVFVCTENKVAVLLGNGDGSFQPYSSYLAGYCENTIAVADVNGDGAPDLLVGNQGPNSCAGVGFVGVLLGNGNGTFQPEINFDTGNQAVGGIAVADLNSDGKLDAVATSGDYRNGLVGVVLGNGDGTFQPAISYSSRGSHPDAIVVADLNGDNQPDIVVANFYDGNVSVLMNKGRFLTTTILASSLNPSYIGQPVTFTATVESKLGTIPDGGLVTFYDGTTAVGSGAGERNGLVHNFVNLGEVPHHQGNLRGECDIQAEHWHRPANSKQVRYDYGVEFESESFRLRTGGDLHGDRNRCGTEPDGEGAIHGWHNRYGYGDVKRRGSQAYQLHSRSGYTPDHRSVPGRC